MGKNQSKASDVKKEEVTEALSRNAFVFEYALGRGGFGKVWRVKSKKTGYLFAMKEMEKAKVISKKSVLSIINERNLLQKMSHPFVVKQIYN